MVVSCSSYKISGIKTHEGLFLLMEGSWRFFPSESDSALRLTKVILKFSCDRHYVIASSLCVCFILMINRV